MRAEWTTALHFGQAFVTQIDQNRQFSGIESDILLPPLPQFSFSE